MSNEFEFEKKKKLRFVFKIYVVKKKINNFLVENVKFIGSEFDFCFGEKIIGLGKM